MNKKNHLNENTIVRLFHDPRFLSKFEQVNTEEEIIKIFNQNHVPITPDDLEVLHNICEKYIDRGAEIIDEESFLENIAAGKSENIKDQDSEIAAKKIINILS